MLHRNPYLAHQISIMQFNSLHGTSTTTMITQISLMSYYACTKQNNTEQSSADSHSKQRNTSFFFFFFLPCPCSPSPFPKKKGHRVSLKLVWIDITLRQKHFIQSLLSNKASERSHWENGETQVLQHMELQATVAKKHPISLFFFPLWSDLVQKLQHKVNMILTLEGIITLTAYPTFSDAFAPGLCNHP